MKPAQRHSTGRFSMKSRPIRPVPPSACARGTARPARSVLALPAAWSVAATAAAFGLIVGLYPALTTAAGDAAPVAFVPEARALVNKVLLLDAAKAGKRFVVVGERGRILYSDDDGQNWKVADSPVLTTLTSVAFSDERNGMAVGHRGTVLLTHDGGATWQGTKVQAKDQNALLSVWTDGKDGIAVGAYGTYIETRDAGNSWVERRILGEDFDRHINAVVAGKRGAMLLAGEAGTLALSTDRGQSWTALKSPYEGTFFGGLGLSDGTALVFGMRGTVLRSTDNGRNWTKVDLGHYKGAVQNGAELPDGSVVLVGAGGLIASSRDKGTTFDVKQTKDRRHIGGVVFGSSGQLLITGEGGARWADFTLPK
jgi:photosystem II stability/assembly factor-like uncharacterized protein